MRGLSYRQVARILEISHTTVQKLAETIYQPKLLTVKKQRNFIAVDESVIKIKGKQRYLRAAIDVEIREISENNNTLPSKKHYRYSSPLLTYLFFVKIVFLLMSNDKSIEPA